MGGNMRLRNKKTGEAVYLDIRIGDCIIGSLKEFNEIFEEYSPKQPLIKDEKIRKAVRAWAEVCKLDPDFTLRYLDDVFRLDSYQCCIEFNSRIEGLTDDKTYTIAELCGEEE